MYVGTVTGLVVSLCAAPLGLAVLAGTETVSNLTATRLDRACLAAEPLWGAAGGLAAYFRKPRG